jgi:hypothetical protein
MKKFFSSNQPFVTVVFLLASFLSCSKEKSHSIDITKGALIANEGNFGHSDASVSYYNYEKDSVYEDIFSTVNGRALGDVLQSICINGDRTYLVVNSSNKIEVVSSKNFESAGVIKGVSMPRYMTVFDNKGYVSCWGDSSLKVIDLNSLNVTSSIHAGSGPEKMLIYQDKLFLANCGGYGTDSTLSVIDLNSGTLLHTLTVGYNPYDITIDKNHSLWVVCYGKAVYGQDYKLIDSSASELVKINPNNYTIDKRITISDTKHAMYVEVSADSNDLYFGGGFAFGAIFKLSISNPEAEPVLFCNDYAYGFNINPSNGEVYVTIAPSYIDAGILKRYNAEGNLLGTYSTGISPKGVTFIGD